MHQDLVRVRSAVETELVGLQERMEDPVILADTVTYERAAAEEWLRWHNVSPLDLSAKLEHVHIMPNNHLRSAC